MKISLIDVDGTGFPNLALMKISAWHKANGDTVDWYSPMFSHPDKIYASKIFTFTTDHIDYYIGDPEPMKGGTGYDVTSRLPDEIDRMLPDYSIYPSVDFAIGFLSRGCIRKCPWCVVPKKEGAIRHYTPIETVSTGADLIRRKHVVLMDNNFLANDLDYIEDQIDRSHRMNLRIDFNQGLDARLVNETTARILCRVKWLKYVRFSCDTQSMVTPVINAIRHMRNAGYTREFFIYFLAEDAIETHDRIMRVLDSDAKVTPYVMPYRNLDGDGDVRSKETIHLARWANKVWIRKSCTFTQYKHNYRKELKQNNA